MPLSDYKLCVAEWYKIIDRKVVYLHNNETEQLKMFVNLYTEMNDPEPYRSAIIRIVADYMWRDDVREAAHAMLKIKFPNVDSEATYDYTLKAIPNIVKMNIEEYD